MQRSESREPTNILYVAIKVQDSESDAEVSKKLDSFCEGRLAQLMLRRRGLANICPYDHGHLGRV